MRIVPLNEFDVVVIIRRWSYFPICPALILIYWRTACAQFPLPIITGIGHERDDTVLDSVAHTSGEKHHGCRRIP